MATIPQAKNINEVISLLNEIIESCIQEKSTLGYFAVLYCKVTEKVKEGIANGMFEDGPRMEQLDVVFANRYIEAYYQYKANIKPSKSWEIAFTQSTNYWNTLLQHLLLGMNAHINLDLGIAAAQIAPGDSIHSLEKDFNTINTILSSLVDKVELAISDVWPFLKTILKKTQNIDTLLVDFSMKEARDGAWKFALELAPLDEIAFNIKIQVRDTSIAKVADLIVKPGRFISFIFKVFRLLEKGSIDKKIEMLKVTI
jgi:hypothetical protein